MEIVRRVHQMKELCRQAHANGRKVGLVPTMGALHEGHLSLIRRAKELADVVVTSVFVNPTQFGPEEDFSKYPRDLARDADLCIAEEVDYLFAPAVEDLYPAGACTFVEVEKLSGRFEGASRETHFRGVTTVVQKLFQVVQPTLAAFGQKDAQQAVIVRRMVRDLLMDVELLVLPTVREPDGLALSSRNRYLSEEEREAALAIPRALAAAEAEFASTVRHPEKIVAAARKVLEDETRLRIDYLDLVDADDLEPVSNLKGRMVLLVAAWSGKTRLLDNLIIQP